MDDRRFDQLVKAVASGASRRSVLKGMLGLGGAALVGSAALDPDVDAARRPTPTPKPLTCPGNQTPVGGQCVCQPPKAIGPYKCGPACCTGLVTDGYPRLAGHSECCDNACCFGTCYGEELCCPTNLRGSEGQLPALAEFCPGTNECCPAPDFCCRVDGCCDTFCYGGPEEDSFCCPDAQACPGDSGNDQCCNVGETCCGAGTNDTYCVDLSDGGCCEASDCAPQEVGCGVACFAGHCEPTICLEGQICCQDECLSLSEYEACPEDPNECCDRETDVCCGDACCARGRCNAAQQCCGPTQYLCGVNCCDMSPGGECCGGNTCCEEGKCAGGGQCCTGSDIACESQCCPTERCLAGVGCCDEGTVACGGGCCSLVEKFCNAEEECVCNPGTVECSLLPGPCCPVGQCTIEFFCCPDNTTACVQDCCDNATQVCSAQGMCECAGGAILCGDECTPGECCADELPPERCQAIYGYDLECVTCPSGFCDNQELNGVLCSTDDSDEPGICVDGYCIPCGGPSAPCLVNQDCCSGVCLDELLCTDQ